MKYEHLIAIFNGQGHWVRTPDQKIIGKGVFETDLEEQGFTKSELRRLVGSSILKKFQVRQSGALRNSYVLPLGGLENVGDDQKAATEQSLADGKQTGI